MLTLVFETHCRPQVKTSSIILFEKMSVGLTYVCWQSQQTPSLCVDGTVPEIDILGFFPYHFLLKDNEKVNPSSMSM